MQSRIQSRVQTIDINGLNSTASAYATARIAKHHAIPVVAVTDTVKTAEQLLEHLAVFIHGEDRPVLYFPGYNMTAFKPMAYHGETAARRIQTLYQMIESVKPPLIITSATALVQKLIPKRDLIDFAELILAGEEIDRDALIRNLIAGGYTRAMIVEEYGDFSLRGGILDVFSPLYSEPLRLEFFGGLCAH